MIHIVFQQADIEVLKESFSLDETMTGEIIQIKDDYAVGPLKNTFTPEGIEARKDWWREVLAGGDYNGAVDNGTADDNLAVQELVQKLTDNSDEIMWIWAAQNKHDVSGYYWLMSRLKQFQGRVYILYLNNLPFINEKGHIFYPTNIFEIPPREFLKARKLARVITPSEFEVDPDEWLKLINEEKGVRTLEGGKKLLQHDYDYYDAEILKFITTDWQKVNKLFNTFFSKSKNTTGDAFMLWRLKQMIKNKQLDAQGELRNMKEFEVKK